MDEHHPSGPLVPRERQGVRGVLTERERRAWLRKQARWWTAWLFGLPGAILIFVKAVIDISDYLGLSR